MGRTILCLFLFFVVELFVIIKVGARIGPLYTIVLMFLAVVLGLMLIRQRFHKAVSSLQQGKLDAQIIFLPLSGFLFIFPGFISDVFALLFLLPPAQKLFLSAAGSFLQFKVLNTQRTTPDRKSEEEIIEAEFTEIPNEQLESKKNSSSQQDSQNK